MHEKNNSEEDVKMLAEICAAIMKKDGLKPIDISGIYSVNNTTETVHVKQDGIECVVSSSSGWKGKGYVIHSIYTGTYTYPPDGKGEHLLLIKKDKNLMGIWRSDTHGSGMLEWIKKYEPYPRTEQQIDMNEPFEK